MELRHPQPLLQLLNVLLLVQLVRTPPQLHLVRTAAALQLPCTPPLTHILRPAKARLASPFVVIKAELRRFVRVSMTRQARHSPFRFSLCLARPERSLWSGDSLGASDTRLDRVGQKGHFERATGPKKCPTPPRYLGDALGTRLEMLGDALRTTLTM
jgi:hypothetical protein